MTNADKIAGNDKFCVQILKGAMGDLWQDRLGDFCYCPNGRPTEEYKPSEPLITVQNDEMLLTPAGASFILENLSVDHGDRASMARISRLQAFASRNTKA